MLPTAGCARHSSGLSVQTFLRGIHVVDYSADALRDVADQVVALAEAEDLPAHGQAVAARFGEGRLWRAVHDRPTASLAERRTRLVDIGPSAS